MKCFRGTGAALGEEEERREEWVECVRLLAFAHEDDLCGKKGVRWGGARDLWHLTDLNISRGVNSFHVGRTNAF